MGLGSWVCLLLAACGGPSTDGPLAQGAERLRHDDVEGAIAAFDRAVTETPEDPTPYEFRAAARFQAGELDRAIDDLEQAEALGWGTAYGPRLLTSLLILRAHALASEGDLTGAEHDHAHLRRLAPDDPRVALLTLPR